MSLVRAVEAIDLVRTKEKYDNLARLEQTERHHTIKRSGIKAVRSGDITADNVADQVRATVARHVGFMELHGFDETERRIINGASPLSFEVRGRPLKVAPGIWAQLIQKSTGGRAGELQADGWQETATEFGVQAALRDYSEPATTVIEVFGTDEHGNVTRPSESVFGSCLGRNPGGENGNDWSVAESSWSGRNEFAALVPQIGKYLPDRHPISELQLVAAAGNVVEFNRELDVVQWAMNNYPL